MRKTNGMRLQNASLRFQRDLHRLRLNGDPPGAARQSVEGQRRRETAVLAFWYLTLKTLNRDLARVGCLLEVPDERLEAGDSDAQFMSARSLVDELSADGLVECSVKERFD